MYVIAYIEMRVDGKMIQFAARWSVILFVLFGMAVPLRAQTAPNIAAAADLRLALTDVAAAFERDTGQKVRLNFGSSGNFYRQIRQGAPFELYLSADENYVLALAKAGKTKDRGVLYAVGRLALVVPKGSPISVDSDLTGLRAALRKGQVTRFAIANPEHAPYGARAEEALKHSGLWGPLTARLVFGENVSQALQFATSGTTQGGLVAYSLVFDPGFAERADYALVPASWHGPLRQRMVLIKGAGAVAQRFYHYIQQPSARAIFKRYGLMLPGKER